MTRLYNTDGLTFFFGQKRRKEAIFVTIAVAVFITNACRKTTPAPPAVPPAVSTADAVRQADDLYSGRADLIKVRQGIVALRQAQATDPSNYDSAWRLAKFNYYLGSHTSDQAGQDKAFRDGIDAGKLAVELQAGKADGHFWLGANYGGIAQISILAGLAEIEDIKREMQTVLKIDERYQGGSAYLVLGQVYQQSPRILGGGIEKAIEYFEKGLRIASDNALLRAHLAEAYTEAHRNGDARRQIEALLAMKPSPGYEPEYNDAVAQVKKLQEKIK